MFGHVAKGMVLVAGKTYRLSKLERGKYEVIRIIDDCRVGTFESTPRLNVKPDGIDSALLKEIAIAALRLGKLSWAGPLTDLPKGPI